MTQVVFTNCASWMNQCLFSFCTCFWSAVQQIFKLGKSIAENEENCSADFKVIRMTGSHILDQKKKVLVTNVTTPKRSVWRRRLSYAVKTDKRRKAQRRSVRKSAVSLWFLGRAGKNYLNHSLIVWMSSSIKAGATHQLNRLQHERVMKMAVLDQIRLTIVLAM